MHTVVETNEFMAAAKRVGMTEADRTAVVDMIARDPMAGDLIVGSGGLRKVRVAGRGKGKSGGYRVVTYYAGLQEPVVLLSVLSKGSDANFSAAQIKAMTKSTRSVQ